MASNFGQLCRDLIGGSLTIKGKRVIDEKGNMKPYDLTVRQTLTVNGDACLNNASINNIEIVNDYQPYDIMLIQRPTFIHEDFVGEYAEENWTIDLQGGSVAFSASGNTVTMISADVMGGGQQSNTTACITKTFDEKTNVYFTWDYTSNDIDGPAFDPFGYKLNGVFNQLTSDDFGNVGNVQSGCEIVCVPPHGQFTFCFDQGSTDQDLGPATTVISNFKIGGKAKIVGKKWIGDT